LRIENVPRLKKPIILAKIKSTKSPTGWEN